MSRFASLVRRLKEAKGGRFAEGMTDLTADIYEALGYEVIRRRRSPRGVCWRYRGEGLLRSQAHWCSMQWFSMSIDDALGLVEQVIGTGLLSVEIHHETRSHDGAYPAVTIRWKPFGEANNWHCAVEGASTIPLALMAALFEAMDRPTWRMPASPNAGGEANGR